MVLQVLDLKRPEQIIMIFFLFSDFALKRRLLKLRSTEDEEEGAVDGVVGGPRLGKERQLSHDRVKIESLYFTI